MINKDTDIKPNIYTVATFDYLPQSLVALKSAKNLGNFSKFFVFVIDIKDESIPSLKRYLSEKFPWVNIFTIYDFDENYRNIIQKSFDFYSGLEISCLSKFIALNYLSSLSLKSNIFVFADGDFYFYSDISVSINQLKNNAFLLTPHHLLPLTPSEERNFCQKVQ